MKYKIFLDKLSEGWMIKNVEVCTYFDFRDVDELNLWWTLNAKDCSTSESYYHQRHLTTDYKTAHEKYKELINGETTVKNTEEFVNANIKSKRELAQRLLDGEVFYSGALKYEICFDDSGDNNNPFRSDGDSLNGIWDGYQNMTIKQSWYDRLDGEPVLCFVSNESEEELANKNDTLWVYEYRSEAPYKFRGGCNGLSWKFATPVTKEDIL